MIVQVMRLSDGKRRLTSVTEITGMEGQVVQMQEIFAFHRISTEADGTVVGEFRATGLRPKCMDEMLRRGIRYDTANFDPEPAAGLRRGRDAHRSAPRSSCSWSSRPSSRSARRPGACSARGRRGAPVNRRLATAERTGSLGELVLELRKQRGLTEDGRSIFSWAWLADLVMRSGVTVEPRRWAMVDRRPGAGGRLRRPLRRSTTVFAAVRRRRWRSGSAARSST